jgi:hypothetical protein
MGCDVDGRSHRCLGRQGPDYVDEMSIRCDGTPMRCQPHAVSCRLAGRCDAMHCDMMACTLLAMFSRPICSATRCDAMSLCLLMYTNVHVEAMRFDFDGGSHVDGIRCDAAQCGLHSDGKRYRGGAKVLRCVICVDGPIYLQGHDIYIYVGIYVCTQKVQSGEVSSPNS